MKTIIRLIASTFIIAGCVNTPNIYSIDDRIDSVGVTIIYKPIDDTPDSLLHDSKWIQSADSFYVFINAELCVLSHVNTCDVSCIINKPGKYSDGIVYVSVKRGATINLSHNKDVYITVNGSKQVRHETYIKWGVVINKDTTFDLMEVCKKQL